MERANLRARHHRFFRLLGGVQRAIGHRHNGVYLEIDPGNAIEMGLYDLDRRELPARQKLGNSGGVHVNDLANRRFVLPMSWKDA